MSDEFKLEDFDSYFGPRNVYIDIVFCIDLTGSMGPVIQKINVLSRSLYEDCKRIMLYSYNRAIKQFRIKVIGFRDIYCDGAYAFEVSDFFSLPEQSAEFLNFIDKLEAKGGGDVPENSLEALVMAMQSDWCTPNEKNAKMRQFIVLFTDAPAHPFEKAITYSGTNYPANMPESYDELVDLWSGQASFAPGVDSNMDQSAKRLVIFAPESCEPWGTIADDFDACFTEFIMPGKGGSEITNDFIRLLVSDDDMLI